LFVSYNTEREEGKKRKKDMTRTFSTLHVNQTEGGKRGTMIIFNYPLSNPTLSGLQKKGGGEKRESLQLAPTFFSPWGRETKGSPRLFSILMASCLDEKRGKEGGGWGFFVPRGSPGEKEETICSFARIREKRKRRKTSTPP